MKPVYEIVRADELQAGDVVTIEPDLDPWIMDDVRLTDSHLFYRGDGQGAEFSMPRDRRIFRQLPPGRNPEVLMRALDFAYLNDEPYDEAGMNEFMRSCMRGQIAAWIEQAIRELESEGRDGQ